MKSIARLSLVLSLLLVPGLAAAQTVDTTTTTYSYGFLSTSGGFTTTGFGGCSGTSVCGIANTILYLINSVLVPVIFAIAFIVFIYGVFKSYIVSGGSESAVAEGHKLILWGIVGFVVMISLWGLVNVVANTFGLTGISAPILPKSY